ncbi:hypothetical protein FRC11_012678, partial [Ceratobasidium sp. 423]
MSRIVLCVLPLLSLARPLQVVVYVGGGGFCRIEAGGRNDSVKSGRDDVPMMFPNITCILLRYKRQRTPCALTGADS